MIRSRPPRTAGRPARSAIVISTAVVIAAFFGTLGYQSWVPSPSVITPWRHTPPSLDPSHDDHAGALGAAAGVVPDGVTVFDDDIPAVAKLNTDLLRAVRRAATDATDDGVTFYVNSGWRSPEYQNQLLRLAVSKYGSEAEAARWVATADTSPHVSGGAIDIGHSDAAAWLSEHGAEYGLCQIYGNEPWHFELRPDAVAHGCPPLYADPTHDPRMQP